MVLQNLKNIAQEKRFSIKDFFIFCAVSLKSTKSRNRK